MQDVHHLGLNYSGLSRGEYDELQKKIDAAVNTEDYRYRDNDDGTYDYVANHNGGENAFQMCFYSRDSGRFKAGDVLIIFYSAPWNFADPSFQTEAFYK